MRRDSDTAARVVQVCLRAAQRVNQVFVLLTVGLRVLIMPQISQYQWWVCTLYFAQVLCSDLFLIMVAKTLQVHFQIENFLLLLSLGSVLPFAYSVHKLWFFIPCPPMASAVSNISLAFALGVLFLLGLGTFQDNYWMIYTYVMTTWPWLVVASAVARLYVERNIKKNPFSPVRELPMMGVMSSFIMVLTLLPAKSISLTDCIVLYCFDPILAAILASCVLGKTRRRLHFRSMKMYAIMGALIVAYIYGDVSENEGFRSQHLLFALARLMAVVRSMWVKWQYSTFHKTKAPLRPPESELLFFEAHKPKKHRFRQFPAPLLLTLDTIFDSGLRDSDFHAMGPVGTQDLYMLTESTYLLPIASLMAWLVESETMVSGLLPATSVSSDGGTAVSSVGFPGVIVTEEVSTIGNLIVVILCVSFCMARAITPWVASKSLFDWGSSSHSWKYQPIITAVPFLLVDILFLNGDLSKFQIVAVLLLFSIIAVFRADIWNSFKRKFLLLLTQDLFYYQPAVLRQLQRRTLLEFLEKTSTDDYCFMLLDTCIRHGGNIRELARDTNLSVWDPAPSATAAWKLAFSLVTKSLKKQKIAKKHKREVKQSVEEYISKMVIDVVYKAVDTAEGHGSRLRLAGSLASVMGKRRAIRRLQALATHRRLLRKRRQAGQLSGVHTQVAASGGVIRSVRDLEQQRLANLGSLAHAVPQAVAALPGPQPMAALLAPEVERTSSHGATSQLSQGALMHMSLNQSSVPSLRGAGDGEEAPLLALPGAFMGTDDASSVGARSVLRGVWATADMIEDASSFLGCVVIAWGDARYGQLGIPADRKVAQNRVVPIEELRGCSPVQVTAAGVGSFVVGAKGQLWSFGSNRSLELGLRKEVTQVNVPQRTKAIREQVAVQIAGSPSASGQAHTLVLTNSGQVYTFGTSSCGALGHGSDVRQTAPLLLRMTNEVKIRTVAAGARHSILITDDGKVYATGDNTHGQLGQPKKARSLSEPELVGGELAKARVNMVAAGDDHTLVSTEDGRLFAWGSNANGQLGLGRLDDQSSPQCVKDLSGGLGILSMACGARHSLVVTRNGKQVWAFGSNVQGQLGVGPNQSGNGLQLSVPALVHTLSGHRDIEITQVAAASCHSLALSRAGEVHAFGENSNGQLGFPAIGAGLPTTGAPRSVLQRRKAEIDAPYLHAEGVARLWLPTRILSLGLYRVRSISTADMHSLALAM